MYIVLNSWRCLEYLQNLKTSNGYLVSNIVQVQFFVRNCPDWGDHIGCVGVKIYDIRIDNFVVMGVLYC